MSYVLFVAGSIIEFFSLTTLMLVGFRIETPKRRLADVLILAALLAQVSYFTRLNISIGELSSFIQLGLTVLVVWLIFNIPLFHSLLMNLFAMGFGFVGQALIIFTISLAMDVPMSSVISESNFALPAQILSTLLFLTTAYVIKTYNLGFSFVPTSRREYVNLRGLNVIILTVITAVIVILSIASVALSNDFDTYLYIVVGIFVLSIPLFLYYSLRKDNENAEKSRRIFTHANGRAKRKSL